MGPKVILEELKQYESRVRGALPASAELTRPLTELDGLDLDALATRMAGELSACFRFWGDPEMTGRDPVLAIQGVLFEFSDSSDESYAYAYGSSECEETPRTVEDVRGMGDINAFSEAGGINIEPISTLCARLREAGGNPAGRVALARLAQVLCRAMERARQTPEFRLFPRRAPLYLYVGEHDLGALLAYVQPEGG